MQALLQPGDAQDQQAILDGIARRRADADEAALTLRNWQALQQVQQIERRVGQAMQVRAHGIGIGIGAPVAGDQIRENPGARAQPLP